MDSFLEKMLQRYTGGSAARAPEEVDADFDEVARAASPDDLAEGLAEAFRSDRTPPFPEMLGDLFRRTPASQRAGIVQMLLRTLGPAVLSQILARRAGHDRVPAGLGRGHVSDQEVEQIPPEVITEAAAEAEKRDPSIIDQLSRAYARQPQIVKALGAGALAIALGRLAQRQGAL